MKKIILNFMDGNEKFYNRTKFKRILKVENLLMKKTARSTALCVERPKLEYEY